jgi:Kef-type K+ transport system membrane component KefB
VTGIAQGQDLSPLGIVKIAAMSMGFLVVCLLMGPIIVGPLARMAARINLRGTTTVVAIGLAFGLAWLAPLAGSAPILGGFAAGVLLRRTPQALVVEQGVRELAAIAVPVFFVALGAAVDLRAFSPLNPAHWPTLTTAGVLLLAAMAGKVVAGYVPFWVRGNKLAIGLGMIPRGEIGLVFVQMTLTIEAFDMTQLSAVMLAIVLTTFLTPLLLRFALPPPKER